jgi:hypothetical protein
MRITKLKTFAPSHSLSVMKIRILSERRATWRVRFLEIARQVESGNAPRSLVVAAGLRPRPQAPFFTPRRTRPA